MKCPRIVLTLALSLLAGGMTKNVLAQEASESEAPEPEAQVIKVGESTYRLGEIVFDAKKREIRIPAVMNMREGGPIEYLMVNEKGAVHEALLTTPVRGLHLQIVFKLLRYRSGEGEIFDQFLPEEERRQRIESDEKKPRGDAVSVIIEMEKDGKIEEIPAASWILDAETGKAMTDEPWILTGSHFFEGNFLADSEGSLIGVYLDQVALLNMSRKGAENDERWGANSAATPETGKKMTLILRPAK